MRRFIVGLLMFVSTYMAITAEETVGNDFFSDIPKEHWAYKAVENLVYKGVVIPDKSYNGAVPLTRYDMAVFLSRMINKIDDEKASKDDVLVLEKLVEDFSKDLTAYGFNVNEYNIKLKKIESDIENNNNRLAKHEEAETKLSERLNNLELKLKAIEAKDDNKKDEAGFGSDFKYGIRGLVAMNDIYQHVFGTEYQMYGGKKGDNYEIFVRSSSADTKASVEGRFTGKAFSNTTLELYTSGYEKYITSYLGHITIDTRKAFGFSADNPLFNLWIQNDGGDFRYLNKFMLDYFSAAMFYSEGSRKVDYETALKFYSQGFEVAAGYTLIGDNTFYDIKTGYANEPLYSVTLGYQQKNNIEEKNMVYDMLSAKGRYNMTKEFSIFGLYESVGIDGTRRDNVQMLFKNKIGGFTANIAYENKKCQHDSIKTKKEALAIGETEKNQVIAKLTFDDLKNIKPNFTLMFSSGKNNIDIKNVVFVGVDYLKDDNNKISVSYIKSSEIFRDSEIGRNLTGEIYDMDFDPKTTEINASTNGLFKIMWQMDY